MSNVTTYRVSAHWFGDAFVDLRVNADVLTPELAEQINTFCSGADDRLRAENCDVVRAVVRDFGCKAIYHFVQEGGASFGPTSKDRSWTELVIAAQGEGWPDVDRLGILITEAMVPVVGYYDVEMKNV